jgi:hypothetical protein
LGEGFDPRCVRRSAALRPAGERVSDEPFWRSERLIAHARGSISESRSSSESWGEVEMDVAALVSAEARLLEPVTLESEVEEERRRRASGRTGAKGGEGSRVLGRKAP